MMGGESQRIAFGYHRQILKRCVLERCGFNIKRKRQRKERERQRQKEIESDRDREEKETEK